MVPSIYGNSLSLRRPFLPRSTLANQSKPAVSDRFGVALVINQVMAFYD